MTPKFWLFVLYLIYYKTKNVGIHLLLICFLRPTTALQVDEQSDTHERIADLYPTSVH